MDWGLWIAVVVGCYCVVEHWPEAFVRVFMRFDDNVYTVLEKQRFQAKEKHKHKTGSNSPSNCSLSVIVEVLCITLTQATSSKGKFWPIKLFFGTIDTLKVHRCHHDLCVFQAYFPLDVSTRILCLLFRFFKRLFLCTHDLYLPCCRILWSPLSKDFHSFKRCSVGNIIDAHCPLR